MLGSLSVLAQTRPIRFEHLSLNEGLSEAIVNDIAQDHNGFLWFGTQDGLNRYDGYHFEHFKHDPSDPFSIPDNHVFRLFVDRQNQMWVGTDGGGLSQYDTERQRFISYRHNPEDYESLSSNDIRAIANDRENRIWIGTAAHGLNRLQGGIFIRYIHQERVKGSLSSDQVNDLLLDRQGILWIGTSKGLDRYDEVHDNFQHAQLNDNKDTPIIALYEDRQNRLWLGTANGLLLYNREKDSYQTFLPETIDRLSTKVTAIYQDDADRLWIGWDGGGLSLFDPTQGTFETYQNRTGYDDSLSNNQVTSLYQDHSGVLWVGTRNGISKFNRQSEIFTWYRKDPANALGLIGQQVWAIHVDYQDELWVGTQDGISRYNASREKVTHYQWQESDPSSLSHNAIRDFIETDDASFWIATRGGGLNLMNRQEGTFKAFRHDPNDPDSISHDRVWQLHQSKDLTFWIATAGGGLNTFNFNQQTFKREVHDPKQSQTLSNNQVSSILEDRHGTMWFGTFGGGLNKRIGPNQYQTFQHNRDDAESLSHNRILSLFEDNKGDLWIGTWGGLNHFNPETQKFKAYRAQHGLPSEVVYGILEDSRRNLWMSTNRGLCRFDPRNESFFVYDVRDGLQSSEFNSGAYFKDNRGRHYFGGVNGLNTFDPSLVRKDPRRPITQLTRFTLLNRDVSLHETSDTSPVQFNANNQPTIHLGPKDYVFSFEFTGLHFAAPGKNLYAYKLEGLDDEWVTTSADRRYASYTNLDPGTYHFRVKSANKDAFWDVQGTGIQLVVHPPAYNTWWARTLYVLAGLLTLAIVILIWRRKLNYEIKVRETIRQSEERLKFALWGSGDEHWDWDLQTNVIYRSNQSGMLAFPENTKQEDINNLRQYVHPKDFPRLSKAWEAHITGKTPYFEATYRVKGKRRDWVSVLDRGKIMARDEHGKPARISGTIKDITRLKETEDKLSLIAIAFESTSDAVFITDKDCIIVAVNQGYTRITGRVPDDVIGRPYRVLRYLEQEENLFSIIMTALKADGKWHGEVWDQAKNGDWYLQEMKIDLVRDSDGEVSHYVGVFSDITFRKQAEEELRHLANYDSLTDLPNRTLFREHLEQAINESQRTGEHFAVLFLDLDHFKKVNDSLGHSIGDMLLKEVSLRLSSCIRKEDIVSRLGGDEFALLLKNIKLVHGAAKVAKKIIESLDKVFNLEGHNVVITPSIGIVLFPSDGHRPEELLRNADTAMYHAKSRGRNNFQFFTDEMNERVMKRLQLEADLRLAIASQELVLNYQPKINLKTGDVCGMEALVRWLSPKHGFVSPANFIPVAEETGLIILMGKQILERACREARHWLDENLWEGRLSVNLSPLQFHQKDLLETIDEVLAKTRFPAERLELEITESALMEYSQETNETMHALKRRGIHLSIDDFGTGYSSLSRLRQFPVNALKIDRSFVVDMAIHDEDKTIVTSIIGLAHSLGLTVVAEGVETFDQVEILRAQGCEEIQGFLFSKALPPQSFEKLLREKANLFEP